MANPTSAAKGTGGGAGGDDPNRGRKRKSTPASDGKPSKRRERRSSGSRSASKKGAAAAPPQDEAPSRAAQELRNVGRAIGRMLGANGAGEEEPPARGTRRGEARAARAGSEASDDVEPGSGGEEDDRKPAARPTGNQGRRQRSRVNY